MSIYWDIEVFAELPSTQSICKNGAEDGKAEGYVVRALKQTQGKGRHGKSWVSDEGGLAFSFVLRPGVPVKNIGQISIAVGVALAEVFVRYLPESDVKLKWPNDVFLEGKKAAGILLETNLNEKQNVEWLVVGIGINFNSAPDIGHALCNFSDIDVEPTVFLNDVLSCIGDRYATLKSAGFETIRKAWLGYSYPVGTLLNVGRFHSLDEMGNLIVRDEAGSLKSVSAGDVHLKEQHYAVGH